MQILDGTGRILAKTTRELIVFVTLKRFSFCQSLKIGCEMVKNPQPDFNTLLFKNDKNVENTEQTLSRTNRT